MINKNKILLLFMAFNTVFLSCDEDEPVSTPNEPKTSYIINYGSYSGDKSTITSYDKETGIVANNFYESVNGVAMISNVQHACSHNGKIYFMGNSADQLFWVDGESFEQTENGISDDIVKPRYGVGNGNYLYVSCWGGDIWVDVSVSYIAKVNLDLKKVEKKIALPGGPEGMVIVHNKLYAALGYKDSIAVMDLNTEEISYIALPEGNIPSYLIKDNQDNLYVNLGRAFGDYTTPTGIAYINTSTDLVIDTYDLNGVSSSSYVNIFEFNDDFTKLFVMTSGFDADWNVSGGIAVFDVSTKRFKTEMLVDEISGINGLDYYNEKVFCFAAESVTGNGKALIYSEEGIKESEFETGIAPFLLLSVED